MANTNLRCIDWRNMSFELFNSSSTNGKVDGNQTLSRHLRSGEKIDFFLSHSWHDDALQKWARLEEVVAKFVRARKRYPTFWLDKVCIDQANIGDGLKVLPINITACRQVLALVGDTYPQRLWCVWELFTLFAFSVEATVNSRIKMVPLVAGQCALQSLLEFEVTNAHCYDPNEESRLLEIIETVGARQFEACIRRCAGRLQDSASPMTTKSKSFISMKSSNSRGGSRTNVCNVFEDVA